MCKTNHMNNLKINNKNNLASLANINEDLQRQVREANKQLAEAVLQNTALKKRNAALEARLR